MKIIYKYMYALMITVALSSVQSVFAHGAEPRLELSVDRLNPGGALDLRGLNFDYEEVVSLALIGTGVEISLEEVTANVDGAFTHSVIIPVDLVEGTYYIRGATAHHWVISPLLTVWGAPVLESSGERGREEHDGLPDAVPTFAPGVVPGVVTASAPIAASAPVESRPASSALGTNIFILTGLMALMILVVLALGKKRSA